MSTRAITPPEVRFWRKVEEQGDCWVWSGAILRNGYGYFGLTRSKSVLAHRWAYEQMVATIPAGLVIDHLCRNRACVNPYHLEPVTQQINVNRGDGPRVVSEMRSAKTVCVGGHLLDEENTRTDKRGRRSCKTCSRVADRMRKRAKRAALRAVAA